WTAIYRKTGHQTLFTGYQTFSWWTEQGVYMTGPNNNRIISRIERNNNVTLRSHVSPVVCFPISRRRHHRERDLSLFSSHSSSHSGSRSYASKRSRTFLKRRKSKKERKHGKKKRRRSPSSSSSFSSFSSGKRNIMRLVIIPFLVHVTKHVYILSLGPVLDLVQGAMIETTAIRKTRNDTDRLLHLLIHLHLLLLILKKEEDVSRNQMTGNPLQNG
ncbi:MAG: hypothetical protein AB2693_27325, partial [Candidatus Thiodiazotropha sp.]